MEIDYTSTIMREEWADWLRVPVRLFKQVFDSPPGPRKSTQKIAIFTRYVQVKLLIIPRIFRLYMSY